jgi:hypothetical protein
VSPAKPAVPKEQFQHIFDMGVSSLQVGQIIVTVIPNGGTKLQQPAPNTGNKDESTCPVGIVLIDAGVF